MKSRMLRLASSTHLTAALLFALLTLVITQSPAEDFYPAAVPVSVANTLPDLGSSAPNTGSVQPNINAQGAGLTYHDNIDGKLLTLTPQYSK